MEDEYTPFLLEMNPKKYDVTLYYKKPHHDIEDGFVETKCKLGFLHDKYFLENKISAVCINIFAAIAKSKNRVLDIENEVTANCIEVEATNWENFVMIMAYIADCRTFKEEYN